jgi:Ca2+-binding RTX toxin-like protein
VNGGGGNDTLDGGPGFDLVFGAAGDDTLNGGLRRDHLLGGYGNDVVSGDNGSDRISGGRDNDVERGGNGNDRIAANQGVDELFGDAGNDRLWALARVDVDTSAGPDVIADTVHGGAGNDRIHTRDGEADRIDCGDGRDRALLDQQDVIIDATPTNANGSCEVVTRADPQPNEDRAENGEQAPQDNDQQ